VANTERYVPKAGAAKRESRYVEFKERFDTAIDGEWLELFKDMVAIANIGGGVIVIGVRNDGSPSGADVRRVLALDGATICDKLNSYIAHDFDDFEVVPVMRDGTEAAAIVVGPAGDAPLTFIKPGTYPYPGRPDRQKSAFGRGPYFRHGAKSEPGTRDDLRGFIEGRLESIREEWLGGIKRVITAPQGSEIVAIERTEDQEGDRAIRITTDENAPLYRAVDWDVTHPHRQTELIDEVNQRLPRGVHINSYDIQSVKRVHEINETTHPEWVHLPRWGTYQYSDDLVTWLVSQYDRDNEFFTKARARYYELTH
jgi:Schlafen, AlbA_2